MLASLLVAALLVGGVANVFYNSPSPSTPGGTEKMNINVALTVKIDGKTTYYNPHDLIMPVFYSYNYCKMFNSSDCAAMSFYWYGNGVSSYVHQWGCTTYNSAGAANLPNGFRASTRCTATAAFLSQDTFTPSTAYPYLQTYLNASGFAPVQAVETSTGTNVVTLTATWTASANQAGIDNAAIGMWNDKAGHFVHTYFALAPAVVTPILTDDLFTTQSVNNGQSFQVIWTVSM